MTFTCKDCSVEIMRESRRGPEPDRCLPCKREKQRKRCRERRHLWAPDLRHLQPIEATLDLARASIVYDPETGKFYGPTGDEIGFTRKDGYIFIYVGDRKLGAHRVAFLLMTGSIPPIIDHANRIKDDNRWCNLRAATKSQNTANAPAYRTNRSGVKGAIKRGSRWGAEIIKDGERHRLGYFDTKEEAGEAYRQAALRLFGEFAYCAGRSPGADGGA